MDETCKIAIACAEWIELSGPPRILFAGMTPFLRFHNSPAPHLEISFIEHGSIEDIRLGDLSVKLPEGWASIHGVHFGNYSPPKPERGRAWCAMLDLSDAPGSLDFLKERPFFAPVKASNPKELIEAFVFLRRLCIRGDGSRGSCTCAPGYDGKSCMFDPAPASVWMKLRMKAALLNLLSILIESSMGRDAGPEAGARPNAIAQALLLMEENYSSGSLSLEWLAGEVSLSPNHFGRLFKAHMRMSPMAYVQSLRLKEAAALLRGTGERVERIARMVGYGDALYFSRLFRREFKMGPRLFRKAAERRS